MLVGFWLGRVGYEHAYKLQLGLVEARARGEVGDLVLLMEHDHVYTLGRKGGVVYDPRGIPVYRVERGGYATYHGPGQLVGYPIIDLSSRGLTVVGYIRLLEDVIIRSLKRLGVEASRVEGFSGVWYGGKKVASIGIAVKGWITYHGFAVNVKTDLSYFNNIDPCNLGQGIMINVSDIVKAEIDLREYAKELFRELANALRDRGVIVDLVGDMRIGAIINTYRQLIEVPNIPS
ncbi:MAG TPA: lipoyl(octanoyl) transferase LipB [Sulfolobales archaeon]|nr:lipoyl(octanoyl) transferase LipB [Sulfolobales archaeon]